MILGDRGKIRAPDSAALSPSRQAPLPPDASTSTGAGRAAPASTFEDFDFNLDQASRARKESTISIPLIIDGGLSLSPSLDSVASKSRGDLSEQQTNADGLVDQESPEHKPSVRERRRPTDTELRLPAPQRPKGSIENRDSSQVADDQQALSGTFSLFPKRSTDVLRSPLISRTLSPPASVTGSNRSADRTPPTSYSPFLPQATRTVPEIPDGQPRGDPQAQLSSMPATPTRRVPRPAPSVPPRSIDRINHNVQNGKAAASVPDRSASASSATTLEEQGSTNRTPQAAQFLFETKVDNVDQTTAKGSEEGSSLQGTTLTDPGQPGRITPGHSRNVSFSASASVKDPSMASTLEQHRANGIANSQNSRGHVASKSLESSPAYNFVPGSPVTTFESDLSRAFNLSPQMKRDSQQNGSLERSGTISRLASKMLKHKKSISGSALTPMTPGIDRRKSVTDYSSEIAALQAEVKSRNERIALLEGSLREVQESNLVKDQLEARKSLLVSLEHQLVQTGAEHQSYLHHRHRISDVSVPLGEWKANVVADVDSSMRKAKDNLAGEIQQLLRERTELQLDNDRLATQVSTHLQEISVLEQRRTNLTEMHESMLRHIQNSMEAHKESRVATQPRPDGIVGRTIVRSPSFTNSDNDSKVLPDTYPETDMSVVLARDVVREAHIEEEEETVVVESAVKRMSGDRSTDLAPPKKFNLVKKTKKAFRWGKTPSSTDSRLDQYVSAPIPTSSSFSDRTMTSSKSSDKLSTRSNQNGMFKRTWQSQQNLSSQLEPRTSDGSPAPGSVTMFGNDLTTQAVGEGRLVPQIVTSCIRVIESRALEFEGLYRKSGGAGEMKSLVEAFEIANAEGDTINIPNFIDNSAITSVLKQYLRKLPIPLITFDNYEPFIGTSAIPNAAVRVRAVKEVLRDLPECHYETVRAVFKHLNLVAQHSGANLMTTKNLAVVLSPSIIWDQVGEKEISDMHDKNACIQFCIEHADAL